MRYQWLGLRRGLVSPKLLLLELSACTRRLLPAFLLLYLALLFVARHHSLRDPTSSFFQESTGYSPTYSTVRTAQANQYIQDVENGVGEAWRWRSSDSPSFCVGVATVARNNTRYFKTMVGSLLDGLSQSERADMHLLLFIAHTDPSQHPAYSEPWLKRAPDQVLLYDNATVDIDHIRSLESSQARFDGREKALFDYTYLLKACEAVGAKYVVMLEDDVLAMDGWYHRTQDALRSIREQMTVKGAEAWLYFRLFYTEDFLGWNSEEWPTYLFFSLVAVGCVAFLLLGARSYQPKIRPLLPNDLVLVVCGVFTPLLIGLYFASGRVTMRPIPAGVHEMPKFGCCSQAFVFPQSRVPDLISMYEEKKVGYVDMLTEDFANDRDEIRWAITPSVMQHVGRKSSKDALNEPEAKKLLASLWNFAFETNDPAALRREHEAYLRGATAHPGGS
ncbi:uncharacterized protein APUU_22179A [Aspergillus puulaauensis]|uniref:Integral membrane protein n=1 Tax=Aspergillus puulaauensis TaxID=1220207 RepID=A0A7R8AKL5_9EURO|nr:uncharacterized protein APUU_22179A [Aspergillus puulaauensis]BCS21747.1 hypothetical protein APUU_22179A [Aspergillus puulaauensis]